MGYPMTYQRVVSRNQLADGSYEGPPRWWDMTAPNTVLIESDEDKAKFFDGIVLRWREQAKQANNRARMLAGDLRRLEVDTADEGATCQHIATRTGVDPEVVAAVLKEFIGW